MLFTCVPHCFPLWTCEDRSYHSLHVIVVITHCSHVYLLIFIDAIISIYIPPEVFAYCLKTHPLPFRELNCGPGLDREGVLPPLAVGPGYGPVNFS